MPAKPRPHAATAAALALALILTFAVVALVASSGAAVAAKQPKCGDTITKDTTLHHDLVDCPNSGIVIGANGVTLNLNGHTIDGDGTPAAGCDPDKQFCDVGVLDHGHDRVTVKHGRVRQFSPGVLLRPVRHARVLGISAIRDHGYHGIGFGANGIVVFNATRSLVRNSSGNRNSIPGEVVGSGISLVFVRHSRILDNSFRHNGDHGIFAYKSAHNLIKGNLTSRNKGEGAITLNKCDRNRVRRNRSVRDGTGVFVANGGNRNVITRNRIAHPIQGKGGDGQGVEIPAGDHNVIAHNSIRDTVQEGILVAFDEGVGNVVRRNHVRDAGTNGIYVGDGAKNTNVVLRNHIRGAGEDGVHVQAPAKHTLLKHNHASRAKDDGIDVNNPKTKLTRNEANRNGDLGIEAVRGVNDGGGNVARHNGDPRQCTNIACG